MMLLRHCLTLMYNTNTQPSIGRRCLGTRRHWTLSRWTQTWPRKSSKSGAKTMGWRRYRWSPG